MACANIYQIFYDQKSKQALDPAFTPLDNTRNERPDWYEFWVIRNFLRGENLDPHKLYGFLSPSFNNKTGLRGADLLGFLEQLTPEIDVLLLSPGWDQVAYFKNVFEQGEFWHPGLMQAAKGFFVEAGVTFDPEACIGHSMNSVFSNYFLAKPRFWNAWLEIADRLWDICEQETGELANTLRSSARYMSGSGEEVALKVFIQERIASYLLSVGKFQVVNLDMSYAQPVFGRLFSEDLRTRKLLTACDSMKLEADFSKASFFMEAYRKCREGISLQD